MNTVYTQIQDELKKFNLDKDRIDRFNKAFMAIIQKHYSKSEYTLPLVNEDGSLHYKNLMAQIDRVGTSNKLYDKENGVFIKIPSKEYLLLCIAAIEMQPHAEVLLAAAGYSSYMKNLHEFIIFSGLNNNKSLDEIREKLIEYGYRGDKAIDNDMFFDDSRSECAKTFHEQLEVICSQKNKKISSVLKKTGLYSIRWDVTKNQYYYEAFSGRGKKPIHLTTKQCLSLFNVLDLNEEEIKSFAGFLDEKCFLIEDEQKKLNQIIEKNAFNIVEMLPKEIKAEKLLANEVSVHTKLLNEKVEVIEWEQLDGFIQDNFSSIRSFALFFEDVLDREGMKLKGFIQLSCLPKSSLYEYINGRSVPEFERLTVIASLFSKMNHYIYLTLLKKAGRFEFEEINESPVLMIMETILESPSENRILFGELFDLLEVVIKDYEDISMLYDEVMKTYKIQCSVIVRQIMQLEKSGMVFSRVFMSVLGPYKDFENNNDVPPLSKTLEASAGTLSGPQIEAITKVLRERLGFDKVSPIMLAFKDVLEKQVEE